jgi:hypothetical protein
MKFGLMTTSPESGAKQDGDFEANNWGVKEGVKYTKCAAPVDSSRFRTSGEVSSGRG